MSAVELRIGQRVNVYSNSNIQMRGKIQGTGWMVHQEDGSLQACYLVYLDNFVHGDNGALISVIVVHPNNLSAEEWT